MTAAEIEAAAADAGLDGLRPGAAEQFAAYLQVLRRWNAKLNLTAVREPREIVQRHFIECIQCGQALPEIRTLLDFGSGAGLPGIPIAIVRPEISVTLGESQGKKAAFLREAVRLLGLSSQIYDQRIEQMPATQTFDAVTLRAVDRMQEASRTALQRVRPSGWLIVFGTTGTEEQVRRASPDVEWERYVDTAGMKNGTILLGRKPCST
ncbi:MAG TPA: 16S rRNA (guanine(527)-N(7))-methyltransferase RsmG [Silvibacterium sp.]|nr:16S rRNA (guanine(527)-N(7))-methyltransferase RsmG [Silvibacterium sp.]